MNDLHFLLFKPSEGYFVPSEYMQVPVSRYGIPLYRRWKNPTEEVAKALEKIGGRGTSRQISDTFECEVPIGVVNHHLGLLLEQNRVEKFVGAGGIAPKGGQKAALWVQVS